MDKNKNRNTEENRKNYNEVNMDMFHHPEMSSNAVSFLACDENSNAEECSTSKRGNKCLALPSSFDTGTKTKMSFRNSDKTVLEMNVSSKHRKPVTGNARKSEEKINYFYEKYLVWRKERLNTISKLQDLLIKVHDDQLNFNKTNVMFKELNFNSRMLKESNNSKVDFLASLGTFLTDAASGITSIAQAFNVDAYNTEFKKIMEDDAEITKPLYKIRSQCMDQYRDVEEIVHCFHSETFGNTLQSVSKTLKLDDLWLDINNHEESPSSATINSLDQFISKNANAATVNKIYNSFERYIDSNPAALDACKSAGKCAYGIYDTWGRDQEQRKGIAAETSRIANRMIMNEEKEELHQLRSRVNNTEMTQAKLESNIENAIDSLKFELKEITNIFNMHSGVIN